MKFLITIPDHGNIKSSDIPNLLDDVKNSIEDLTTAYIDPDKHDEFCKGITVQKVKIKGG